jgi:membrane protease YdiL (CAAX protease family)
MYTIFIPVFGIVVLRGGEMSDKMGSDVNGVQEPVNGSPVATSLAYRGVLFVLFLACALAIFVFGTNYYKAFPTNGSSIYSAGVSAVFLIAALLLKRSPTYARYWQIAYAFFAASAVNLVSTLFAGYGSTIFRFLGVWMSDPNQSMALEKLYDALLVTLTILVLVRFSGADLGSLFLKKGSQSYRWGLGIGALVLVNFFTSALIFFGTGYEIAKLGSAVLWGAVFALCNGFLEELWFRGLFLKKLVPLIGVTGTLLLTSLYFAALHSLAVAYMSALVVPIFLVNTFTLGLACAILMLKTDSIWGAFLIHAAADLFMFIAILAVH